MALTIPESPFMYIESLVFNREDHIQEGVYDYLFKYKWICPVVIYQPQMLEDIHIVEMVLLGVYLQDA